MKTSLKDIEVIKFPIVKDRRGNLAIVEKKVLPFEFKRVYYLFDVPSSSKRGGHSHREQQEVLIAVNGSFTVVLDDGKNKKKIFLNKPDQGLLIVSGIWREIENFSAGAICLVFSSEEFDENDYIRSYHSFIKTKVGNW